MLRLESFEIAKIRRDEMLRDAARARLARRVDRPDRPDRQTSGRRIGLRLQALRPMVTFRQAF